MSQLQRVRDLTSRSIRSLHRDEEGLNTIEMVLIVCCAALLLSVAFTKLWGKNSDGIIANQVISIVANFGTFFKF